MVTTEQRLSTFAAKKNEAGEPNLQHTHTFNAIKEVPNEDTKLIKGEKFAKIAEEEFEESPPRKSGDPVNVFGVLVEDNTKAVKDKAW